MATKKARRFARKKTVRRRRTATAGKIMPPLDVRSNKHLADFKKRITKGPLTIVLVYAVIIYADWCGHCQRQAPDWIELAKSADVYAIESEKYSGDDVSGYPTIKIVKDGKASDYTGERTVKDMKSALLGKGNLSGGKRTRRRLPRWFRRRTGKRRH